MAIDVDSGLLWLGFSRGVRVVGSGDFGRFLGGAVEWMVLGVLWRPTRTWGLYAHAKTT